MTRPSCVIIYNAMSSNGNVQASYVRRLAREAGYDVLDVIRVDYPRKLESEIVKALKDNPDQLIVGGGDGTVRTAAEIMIGSKVPLYILPIGTANVFAQNLGIPTSLKKSLLAGPKGKTKNISLGKANGKIFTVALTIGVSNKVFDNLSSKRKAVWGNFAYLTQGLIEFSRHKSFICRLKTADGNDIEFNTHQVTVLNGSFMIHEYFKVYPPHDVAIKTLKVHTHSDSPKKIYHITNAIRQMQKKSGDDFVKTWEVRKAKISAQPEQKVALDAEIVTQTPLEVEILPDALKVISIN